MKRVLELFLLIFIINFTTTTTFAKEAVFGIIPMEIIDLCDGRYLVFCDKTLPNDGRNYTSSPLVNWELYRNGTLVGTKQNGVTNNQIRVSFVVTAGGNYQLRAKYSSSNSNYADLWIHYDESHIR